MYSTVLVLFSCIVLRRDRNPNDYLEWAYGLNHCSYTDHIDPEVNVSPLPCVIFRSLCSLVLVISLDTICSIDNEPIPRLLCLTQLLKLIQMQQVLITPAGQLSGRCCIVTLAYSFLTSVLPLISEQHFPRPSTSSHNFTGFLIFMKLELSM